MDVLGIRPRAVKIECERHSIPSPFSASFHDFGLQFGLMLGEGREIGLDEAVALLGVERFGKTHSGEGDAVTAARTWIATAERMRDWLAPSLAGPVL